MLVGVLGGLALAACHRADLTDSATPVVRRVMALEATARGDTASVTITVDNGPSSSIGSVSASVAHDPAWRHLSCEASQGEALLACKAHDGEVRVAAAWAAGTHAGALVRLTFVRLTFVRAGQGEVRGEMEALRLAVGEVHGVRGQRLTDSLDVRGRVER